MTGGGGRRPESAGAGATSQAGTAGAMEWGNRLSHLILTSKVRAGARAGC
jgi:hypothetical protein